jgi:hypothetical protein
MGNSNPNSTVRAKSLLPGEANVAAVSLGILLGLLLSLSGCAADPQVGVPGPYASWDDVVTKWIGAKKVDLYYELGPPNLHPHELDNGMTELVWDLSIDRMPGQADEYGTLPLSRGYGCRLMFIADVEGIVRSGRHFGCD